MSLDRVKQQEINYQIMPMEVEWIGGESYDSKAMSMARAALKDKRDPRQTDGKISRDESEYISRALFDNNPKTLTEPERRAARKIALEFEFSTPEVRDDFVISLLKKDANAFKATLPHDWKGLDRNKQRALARAVVAVNNPKGQRVISRSESEAIAEALKADGRISAGDKDTGRFIAQNYAFSKDDVRCDFKVSLGISSFCR